MTTAKPRPIEHICAGRTGFHLGGAEGIRTPGLLIANETRYQLRHSPRCEETLTLGPLHTESGAAGGRDAGSIEWGVTTRSRRESVS